jgi:hypothetical protein
MIAVSKSGLSSSSCRLMIWWAVQAMVFDLPDPALCWIR